MYHLEKKKKKNILKDFFKINTLSEIIPRKKNLPMKYLRVSTVYKRKLLVEVPLLKLPVSLWEILPSRESSFTWSSWSLAGRVSFRGGLRDRHKGRSRLFRWEAQWKGSSYRFLAAKYFTQLRITFRYSANSAHAHTH